MNIGKVAGSWIIGVTVIVTLLIIIAMAIGRVGAAPAPTVSQGEGTQVNNPNPGMIPFGQYDLPQKGIITVNPGDPSTSPCKENGWGEVRGHAGLRVEYTWRGRVWIKTERGNELLSGDPHSFTETPAANVVWFMSREDGSVDVEYEYVPLKR
ncbi:MAG: hypothetical protein HQ402_03470 [Parcubacteria group bacterium]|nr:hypothetical protein [Parcubacteria group bacterium]